MNSFINTHYPKILIILIFLVFLNTCKNPNKQLNKKIERLSEKIDSLESITITNNDLKIEGLRVEKRMIQSTDRKIFDLNLQSEIDKELLKLENTK